MSKLLTFVAALTAIFVLSLAGPADAAQRKADGIQNQADQYEVSDQRRYYRRRYYRPYYPYYYGGGYPYYGYGYPGYYRPYRPYGYGAPGLGFHFRF